jgi:hypothetical protein
LSVQVASAAEQAARTNPYIEKLAQVKVPELPATCANLVSAAIAEECEAVTVDVVSAGASINAAALSSVVGAIAKARPEMSALAAATAVTHEPSLTSQIVRAAVGSAPNKAGAIVYAVCTSNPGSYRTVAAIAEQLAPAQKQQILSSVSAALPEQRSFITQAQANGSAERSVAAILADASVLSSQSGLSSETLASANNFNTRGPTLGPPYQPLTGTPTSSDPSTTTNVPPGGRDYATP